MAKHDIKLHVRIESLIVHDSHCAPSVPMASLLPLEASRTKTKKIKWKHQASCFIAFVLIIGAYTLAAQMVLKLLRDSPPPWLKSPDLQRTASAEHFTSQNTGVDNGADGTVLQVKELGAVVQKGPELGFAKDAPLPAVEAAGGHQPSEDISDLAALFFPGAHHDFDIGALRGATTAAPSRKAKSAGLQGSLGTNTPAPVARTKPTQVDVPATVTSAGGDDDPGVDDRGSTTLPSTPFVLDRADALMAASDNGVRVGGDVLVASSSALASHASSRATQLTGPEEIHSAAQALNTRNAGVDHQEKNNDDSIATVVAKAANQVNVTSNQANVTSEVVDIYIGVKNTSRHHQENAMKKAIDGDQGRHKRRYERRDQRRYARLHERYSAARALNTSETDDDSIATVKTAYQANVESAEVGISIGVESTQRQKDSEATTTAGNATEKSNDDSMVAITAASKKAVAAAEDAVAGPIHVGIKDSLAAQG
jgi:hypothetical protein